MSQPNLHFRSSHLRIKQLGVLCLSLILFVSLQSVVHAGEYNRKDWPHWQDVDGDCQNTRAEVLIRDSRAEIKFKRNKPCNVSYGRWICPYTGKVIVAASEADIDHVVPLAHANKMGGADWSRKQKGEFANDMANLLPVDKSANREKGDKSPEEWKPSRREFWPEYAMIWRNIKAKYNLKVSGSEEKALREMEGR